MISAYLLVKNEENRIVDWILSIKNYVEEIIVIDNGSTDNTLTLAISYGCKAYSCNDKELDECRNLYLQHVTQQWVLVLV